MPMMKNALGISMVELAVSLGMLGGVSLLTMRIVQEQSGQDAVSRYKAEVHLMMNELESFLNKTDKCTSMMATRTFGASPGVQVTDTLRYTGPNGTKDVIRIGSYPHFDVSDIRLETNTVSPNAFDVVVTFSAKPNSSGIAAFFNASRSTIVKRVTVIGTTAGTTVQSCGPVVSTFNTQAKEKLCTELGAGFTWNAGTSTCSPTPSVCNPPNIVRGITRIGTVECTTNVNRWIDYNAFFDWTPVSCPTKSYSLYVDSTTNKIRMGCATTLTPAQRAYEYTYPYP